MMRAIAIVAAIIDILLLLLPITVWRNADDDLARSFVFISAIPWAAFTLACLLVGGTWLLVK